MTRVAIWVFGFSPFFLLLVPYGEGELGFLMLYLAPFTIVIAVVAELTLLKKRGTPGIVPSSRLGNWFAKFFAYLFMAMLVVIFIRHLLTT
jgi:hypothetical protein